MAVAKKWLQCTGVMLTNISIDYQEMAAMIINFNNGCALIFNIFISIAAIPRPPPLICNLSPRLLKATPFLNNLAFLCGFHFFYHVFYMAVCFCPHSLSTHNYNSL